MVVIDISDYKYTEPVANIKKIRKYVTFRFLTNILRDRVYLNVLSTIIYTVIVLGSRL